MELSAQPGKILLAEDCLDTQQVLQFMLEQTGAEVVLANNGKECIDHMHNDDFQMVVLDIKMPVVDGVEALRQMRKEGFSQPVVALTASPNDELKSRMEALGIEAFLSKLSDRKSILSTVSNVLKKAQSKERRIPLPILPVYPEEMPNDHQSFVNVMHFLKIVKVKSMQIKDAVRRQAYDELGDCINALGGASLFGYQILASQLEELSISIESNDTNAIHKETKSLHRLLLGILAGKRKIEQKAEARGIAEEVRTVH